MPKKATENVFRTKNPFRSFEIYKKDEKTLGELFVLFLKLFFWADI